MSAELSWNDTKTLEHDCYGELQWFNRPKISAIAWLICGGVLFTQESQQQLGELDNSHIACKHILYPSCVDKHCRVNFMTPCPMVLLDTHK